MPKALDKITDFPALVEYLRDELEWPIVEDSFDALTFEYQPEELGLKKEVVGGGIEIRQLRPLNRAQPWGVFFLNLPNAKLPVTLVRNILGKLAIKKRASANKSEQAAFAKHDLLFIAATGSAPDRRLAFAHFADGDVKGDAATLKVLGWDADDTPRRLGLTEASLKTKLHWPDDPADTDHWRKQWGEAFSHADTRTVVRDSKAMAKALAALARRIRARATELIEAQTATGSLVKLHKAFKEALIHDLTPEGFADTYAQTIAYGLLSTAISRASGALTQDDMAANVTGTSPFLKEMLGTFIEAGGRKSGKAQGLDFDELGITDVVELLRNADMEAVLADFDRKNPDEDPVIHFYELFLKEYDAAQKVKRGVFYTPRPVVGFIVRSVDEVLRTEFGLEDGLASTATWGEVIAASKGKEGAEIALPDGAKAGDPFVRILDPATGTGTFLVACVDLIHKTMVAKWKAAGKRDAEIKGLWNAYVPAHLLPRLTGFELMMAPYAIAHVKLGLKLADTGYTFGSREPARIYLANALEPAQEMQLDFGFSGLAHEATAANSAKEAHYTVVIGNPPYSSSVTEPPALMRRLNEWKKGLGETKADLNREEWKFLKLASMTIERSGIGQIGFIINRDYLDGITKRFMRRDLYTQFPSGLQVDLNGDVKGNIADDNVFDIMQGVSICLLSTAPGSFRYLSVVGEQDGKFRLLKSMEPWDLSKTIVPNPRYYRWLDQPKAEAVHQQAYDEYIATSDIFTSYSSGIQTKNDSVCVQFDKSQMWRVVQDIDSKTVKQVEAQLHLSSKSGWSVEAAKADIKLSGPTKKHLAQVVYSPFDVRWTYYTGKTSGFQARPRRDVLQHVVGHDNVALLFNRQVVGVFSHFGVTKFAAAHGTFYLGNKGQDYVGPLWVFDSGAASSRRPNISPAFTHRTALLTGLAWDDGVKTVGAGARERGEPGKSFGPRDLFDYIYAVLHSPAYRARYADYLKSDFARVPLPGSAKLFETLVPLGTELVALHLLDADALPILKDPNGVRLAGSGDARVSMAAAKFEDDAFENGRMYISANKSRWFETVPQSAADFHVGGYQPARKWLKDRAAKGGKKASDGRVLTEDDILHYRRMIVALTRTAEIMSAIDAVIEKHGGWPDAFRGMTDAAKAEAAE